jgi:hypothetical protein
LKVLTYLVYAQTAIFRQSSMVSSAGAGPGAEAPRRP